MTKSQIRQLHLYHVSQKWKDKSWMLTKLSSVQTADTNALVDLLIIFHAVSFFWHWTIWNLQKQHLQLSKSQPFWKLMSTYNIFTFNHHKYINSYVTYGESLKMYTWKKIFFFWFKMSFSLKNLSYQPDFQNLHYKHHGVVLSNFLQVTKCFQLLLIF